MEKLKPNALIVNSTWTNGTFREKCFNIIPFSIKQSKCWYISNLKYPYNRCCITSFNGRCCEFPLDPIASFKKDKLGENQGWDTNDIHSKGISIRVSKSCSILSTSIVTLMIMFLTFWLKPFATMIRESSWILNSSFRIVTNECVHF